MRISVTERQEFKRCRRQWNWSSLNKERIEPKRPSAHFWLGTAVHAGLEAGAQGLDPIAAYKDHVEPGIAELRSAYLEAVGAYMSPEEETTFWNLAALGEEMLKGYYVYWRSPQGLAHPDGVGGDLSYVQFEQGFEIPIRTPGGQHAARCKQHGKLWPDPYFCSDECTPEYGWLQGTMDGMCMDPRDPDYWLIVEHKTYTDEMSDKILQFDDQTLGYLWAAQQLYGQKKVRGVIYDGLRKKTPARPTRLKVAQGGRNFSIDRSITTTADIYFDALVEAGEDIELYRDFLNALDQKPNPFFKRRRLIRSQQEIDEWGAFLYHEWVEMSDPNLPLTMNRKWDGCWDCWFQELCEAKSRGEDVEEMIQRMYRKRTPRPGY